MIHRPIALRAPDAQAWLAHPVPPDPQARLTQSLQELARIEQETITAQQVISDIDLSALALTHRTVETAEFLSLTREWSPELREFDRLRRQEFLATMHELVSLAHRRVLARLGGEVSWT